MYLYNVTAIVQDRATRRSDPSTTMVAYSPCFCRDKLRVVTSLLPSIYDYAGVSNAVNPSREAAVLLGTFWALELVSKPAWFRLRRVVGLNLLRD